MKKKSASRRFPPSSANFLCTFVLMCLSTSALAQRKGAPAAPVLPAAPVVSAAPEPSTLEQTNVVYENGIPTSTASTSGDNCFLPPLNGLHLGTVGVADLKVPEKAQKEHQEGCVALKSRKIAEAEKHLQKAVKQYPKYSAAWVLLGQVLAAQQKAKEALDACNQPLSAGFNYLPAYLCLSDISTRLDNWKDALKFSTRALEIDPTTNAAAYAYNATANLNLRHLPEAEKSALKASEIAGNNADPRLHFLLAQIYGAEGNRSNEEAQLREYLKYATDPQDTAVVRQYLAKIEGQSNQ
jgi:tetratricopeptide (TPR) repeat protein